MKIGIYNPYFDSLGGGERYCLTLASHWSHAHEVVIFWDNEDILREAKDRLNIDLSRIKIVHNFFREKNILKKLVSSRNYDLIFFLSDGSIPFSLAKRNILHFQSPFPHLRGVNASNKIKLSRYQTVVCNSQFTKKHIDEEYGVDSMVIYPPVAVFHFKSLKKEKIILNVGRFTAFSINKKQKEMVQFFKKLTKNMPDWELRLVGGLLDQDRTYFDQVVRLSEGSPTYVFPNDPFEKLKDNYAHSMIYWHAAGYGEDEKNNPSAMEHFGITTVEAMASGCIPIVYDAGGQREIVRDGVDGFLWKTPEELLEKTKLVAGDIGLQATLRKAAVARSREFDVQKFTKAFDALLQKISV